MFIYTRYLVDHGRGGTLLPSSYYNDQFPVELADLYGIALPFFPRKLLLQLITPVIAVLSIDTGASQHIKLASGVEIESFTEHGLRFADGTALAVDVVCTTMFGKDVCGPEVAQKIKPVWCLDEEGELRGTCRESGCEGLWFALEIKTIEARILQRKDIEIELSRQLSREFFAALEKLVLSTELEGNPIAAGPA
ncbi:hypothetical protein BJ138DRAFT_1101896 [Hygrophoropsis aurantiaca]|uniref:Uncharacterized protein n=1 Tax=Hygrophoropsis aurantiaca TaxID=72124 RepID=A0ACB8AB98_9AGAM|nr:hypothetical protein BJ138DRAFT_1101896 [Hygrophoropsis aurantiaca]